MTSFVWFKIRCSLIRISSPLKLDLTCNGASLIRPLQVRGPFLVILVERIAALPYPLSNVYRPIVVDDCDDIMGLLFTKFWSLLFSKAGKLSSLRSRVRVIITNRQSIK